MEFLVSGNNTLAQINQIISDQEKQNSEFVGNEIATQDNKVTFNLYDDDKVPNELILKNKGDNAPENSARIWEGPMIVSGNISQIVAYRKTG